MKLLITFAALLAVVLAAPSGDSKAEIVRLESDVQPESYKYVVETSDGTKHEEEGVLKEATLVVHGSYTWKDEKDGKVYTVTYVADENGFQPVGDHIPVDTNQK